MARQSSGLKARAEYALFSAARVTLKSLPLERAVSLGTHVGTMAAALDRINRPVAMRNLEIAFPEKSSAERYGILRGMYRNFGRMAAELCHHEEYNSGNIGQFVTYDGIDHWRAAETLSGGRGGFILTGHFGNFELMAIAHALHGHRVALVHRPLRNPFIAASVAHLRTARGNRTVARYGGGRHIVGLLRENWPVAIALDLDVRRGVFVDFFTLKACTSDSVARLAMASRTPVVPVFMVREGSGVRHRIVIMAPVELISGPSHERAVAENTQRFAAILERMVREHPDHWNWIHRRWKTRPPGEPRFY